MVRANTVFLGGSTFLDAGAVRAGVAVTDGRISAVGPDKQVRPDRSSSPTATLVARLLPPGTAAGGRAALLAAQTHLLSLSITAWQDAIVGPYLGRPDNLATYLAADAADELLVRVVGDLWWDRERGLEQLADLRERRARSPAGGRFRPSPRWTPTASRCTGTPSATGPSARRSTRSRRRGRRTAGATHGTTSPTCRFCTPTTCRASRSSA